MLMLMHTQTGLINQITSKKKKNSQIIQTNQFKRKSKKATFK